MKHGVYREDGMWVAYVNDAIVAAGPDRLIIEAAFRFHAGVDEYRSGPGSEPG